MPCFHFLLAIVIAIMLVYKEVFKDMKMSWIYFVKILIFSLFPKVI